mmetsp:Transcript_32753/g.83089  ORF Transcript_32753/g.83089 Transcript_32753/m.83089 type:complete len:265 (+) Transcript_32753:512-1306(+)
MARLWGWRVHQGNIGCHEGLDGARGARHGGDVHGGGARGALHGVTGCQPAGGAVQAGTHLTQCLDHLVSLVPRGHVQRCEAIGIGQVNQVERVPVVVVGVASWQHTGVQHHQHLLMPGRCCVVRGRRAARPISGGRVRPLVQQVFHALDVATLCCSHQGSASLVVCDIDDLVPCLLELGCWQDVAPFGFLTCHICICHRCDALAAAPLSKKVDACVSIADMQHPFQELAMMPDCSCKLFIMPSFKQSIPVLCASVMPGLATLRG